MSDKRQYTEDDKYKVVCLSYLYHNRKEVERQSGIPYFTIRHWEEQAWWKDMMDEVVKEMRAKIRARGHELIDLSIAAVKDRLENGDVILDKHNIQVRKPVNLRDALLVSLSWFDKTLRIDAEEGFVKESPAMLKDIVKDLEAIGKKVNTIEATKAVEDTKKIVVEHLPDMEDAVNDGNPTR